MCKITLPALILILKFSLRFIIDLIIVLSISSLFMRFLIMCGFKQDFSLIIGILAGLASYAYLKFRHQII